MFLTSAPPPGWVGEFSCPYMVKLGSQIVFYVCREHILGVINVPSWAGCGSPATIILLFGACLLLLLQSFVAKQACLVLWLSKPAFLNNH